MGTAPDLYVCKRPGIPWTDLINDDAGVFEPLSGLRSARRAGFSMGWDFGDLEPRRRMTFGDRHAEPRSGAPTDRRSPTDVGSRSHRRGGGAYQCPRNTVRGRGDGTFAEVAWESGLAASDWSWSLVLLDVDPDGYEDADHHGFETGCSGWGWLREIEAILTAERPSDAASELEGFPGAAEPSRFPRDYTFGDRRLRGDLTRPGFPRAWPWRISMGMAI